MQGMFVTDISLHDKLNVDMFLGGTTVMQRKHFSVFSIKIISCTNSINEIQ